MDLAGYERFDFEAPLSAGGSASHPVYLRGEGPPVIIWQELPGIGPQTLALADWLAGLGYRVHLPHLFGPLGQVSFAGNTARVMCMRREFRLFSRHRSSPISRWMAALCAEVSAREGRAGVGTIGMCLTGNFALTMMAEPDVIAGVASQPAMPVAGPRHLHMSPAEIAAARDGMARKGHAIAMQYDKDPLCPHAKMDAIAEAFGDGVEIHRFPGKGHSLLTLDRCEAAFDTVRAYLDARMKGA